MREQDEVQRSKEIVFRSAQEEPEVASYLRKCSEFGEPVSEEEFRRIRKLLAEIPSERLGNILYGTFHNVLKGNTAVNKVESLVELRRIGE